LLQFAACLCLVSVAVADSINQTDWSGNPGVYGPVNSFGSDFLSSSGVAMAEGCMVLLRQIVAQGVASGFDTAYMVDAADIDGDSHDDILGISPAGNELAWWENQYGLGNVWIKHTISYSYTGPTSVYAADIDGDQDNDVLSTSWGGNDVTWWENVNGSGAVWVEHVIDGSFPYSSFAISADFDGDNDQDVVGAQAFNNGDVSVWLNQNGAGTSWTEYQVHNGSQNATTSVYPGDFDSDGDMDILGCSYNQYKLYWWENTNGAGTSWETHEIMTFWHPRFAFAGDFNGDGFCDAAFAGQGTIFILLNDNGMGTEWTYHSVDSFTATATSVHGADQDNDGDMDLFGSEYYAGGFVTFYENIGNSGTTWATHQISNQFGGAYTVRTGDFDGNGTQDPVAAAYEADSITWWNVDDRVSDGLLTSSVLFLWNDPGWGSISWETGTPVPAGSAVHLQVRSGDSPSTMGTWSDTLLNTPFDLSGVLPEGDSYFQYRALLTAGLPYLTPRLEEVLLTWTPVQIDDFSSPVALNTSLLGVSPNPVAGAPVVQFKLGGPGNVVVSVYSITGRLIESIEAEYQKHGVYSTVFSGVPPGIYFCRMSTDSFVETLRFTVIK